MNIKSYPKINIFLKIVGIKGSYHLIGSRFVKVRNFYDTISFEKKSKPSESFHIEGKFSCDIENNLIYKAYKSLSDYLNDDKEIKSFFKKYFVKVEKNIPEFAGLGGGSSNVAAFLKLCDKILSLNLSKQDMINISKPLGSDIVFFIHEYESANVEGTGDIVERFEENGIKVHIYTPRDIKCNTKSVYEKFREDLGDNLKTTLEKNRKMYEKLKHLSSEEILKNFDIYELNDLYGAALQICPKLKEYRKDRFFSGSGSSFFELADVKKG